MTFTDFKKNNYFVHQDYTRIFYVIDFKIFNEDFIVRLFFKEEQMYFISLIINGSFILPEQETHSKTIIKQCLRI